MRLPARKALLVFGGVVFLLFAALQVNDARQYGNTDAWLWIVIYSAMASINLVMLRINIAKHWLYCWCGFTWGALLFRLQDSQGNIHLEWLHPANYWADSPGGATMVQHSNESGGLLILALWACLTCYFAVDD